MQASLFQAAYHFIPVLYFGVAFCLVQIACDNKDLTSVFKKKTLKHELCKIYFMPLVAYKQKRHIERPMQSNCDVCYSADASVGWHSKSDYGCAVQLIVE